MRISYVLSYPVLLSGEAGGALKLIRCYMAMARHLGYAVNIFSPSEPTDLAACDLVHLAPGDLSMLGIARKLKDRDIPFVFSPIIDRTYSNYALRLVTLGDRVMGRLYRSHLGATKEICHLASGVCLMSTYEGETILRGLGVTTKW